MWLNDLADPATSYSRCAQASTGNTLEFCLIAVWGLGLVFFIHSWDSQVSYVTHVKTCLQFHSWSSRIQTERSPPESRSAYKRFISWYTHSIRRFPLHTNSKVWYNVYAWGIFPVATECDTRSIFTVGLTAISWKNCRWPLGTSPFWGRRAINPHPSRRRATDWVESNCGTWD